MGELSVVNDFASKVKEKIKKDFADMLPDEAWDKLVREAVDGFIKTELDAFIKAELATEVRSRLKSFFESPEWTGQWQWNAANNHNYENASARVSLIIKENIPLIIESIMAGAMQNAVNMLRQALQQRY